MSQFSWTLLDDFGHKYEIGLYHGDKSKHVLIHINRKPIVIDFHIKETKLYSFYVGHELCEVQILKDMEHYKYSFVTNQEIDTPLNLARKEQSRKYFILIIALGLALVLFILGISYWMMSITHLLN